jgi:ankyrin repeat protein
MSLNWFDKLRLKYLSNDLIIKEFKSYINQGFDPNIYSYSGRTPLMYDFPYEILELLLDNNADPNLREKGPDSRNRTALFFKTSVNLLELLLKRGADPNLVDCDGNTPLHHIMCGGIYWGYPWIVLFLRYGADITIINDKLQIPRDNHIVKNIFKCIVRLQYWSKKLKWYRLARMVKTREFCEWYYAPDNQGGKQAKKSILQVIE